MIDGKVKRSWMKKNMDIIIRMIFFIILIIYGVYDLNKFYFLLNGVDDIGYWSTAYYFAFHEAKEVASDLTYYAYGYGLIISFFVKIISDPVLLTRVIILLNTLFIGCSYLFLTDCFTMVLKEQKIKNYIISIICFIACLYSSSYIYSKFLFAESYLTFLFLFAVELFIRTLRDNKRITLILFSTVCVSMFFVHQRAISILVSTLVILVLLAYDKKIPFKDFLLSVGFIFILLLLGNILKQNIIDNLYGTTELTAMNGSVSGNASKIKEILSLHGIWWFLVDFFGKWFYFSFSTFMMGGIGLVSIVSVLLKKIYTHTRDYLFYLSIFLVLVWFFTIAIAIVYVLGPKYERYEVVLYGRYIEYIWFIFSAWGLFVCYFRKIDFINIIINIIFSSLGIASVVYQFNLMKYDYAGTLMSNGTSWLFDGVKNLDLSMHIAIKCLIVFSLFLIICYKKSDARIIFYFGVIYIVTCYLHTTRNYEYTINRDDVYAQYEEFIDYIDQSGKEVYYCTEDPSGKIILRIRQLQYLCPSRNFHKLTESEIGKVNDAIVIVDESVKLPDLSDRKLVKYYWGILMYD